MQCACLAAKIVCFNPSHTYAKGLFSDQLRSFIVHVFFMPIKSRQSPSFAFINNYPGLQIEQSMMRMHTIDWIDQHTGGFNWPSCYHTLGLLDAARPSHVLHRLKNCFNFMQKFFVNARCWQLQCSSHILLHLVSRKHKTLMWEITSCHPKLIRKNSPWWHNIV